MKFRMAVAVAVAVLVAGTIGFAQGQGRVVESLGGEVWQGVFISECVADDGSLFDVMNDYEATWRDLTRYEKNGDIAQIVRTVRFPKDVFTNSVTGKTLYGGPGERNEVRFIYEDGVLVNIISTGPVLRINVPGYGPVFIETGHAVYDENHVLLFDSGHNDYRGWAPEAVEALCNALK